MDEPELAELAPILTTTSKTISISPDAQGVVDLYQDSIPGQDACGEHVLLRADGTASSRTPQPQPRVQAVLVLDCPGRISLASAPTGSIWPDDGTNTVFRSPRMVTADPDPIVGWAITPIGRRRVAGTIASKGTSGQNQKLSRVAVRPSCKQATQRWWPSNAVQASMPSNVTADSAGAAMHASGSRLSKPDTERPTKSTATVQEQMDGAVPESVLDSRDPERSTSAHGWGTRVGDHQRGRDCQPQHTRLAVFPSPTLPTSAVRAGSASSKSPRASRLHEPSGVPALGLPRSISPPAPPTPPGSRRTREAPSLFKNGGKLSFHDHVQVAAAHRIRPSTALGLADLVGHGIQPSGLAALALGGSRDQSARAAKVKSRVTSRPVPAAAQLPENIPRKDAGWSPPRPQWGPKTDLKFTVQSHFGPHRCTTPTSPVRSAHAVSAPPDALLQQQIERDVKSLLWSRQPASPQQGNLVEPALTRPSPSALCNTSKAARLPTQKPATVANVTYFRQLNTARF